MSRVIAAYDLDEDHGRLWVNADLKRMPEFVIVANQPTDRAQTVTYVPEARMLEAMDAAREAGRRADMAERVAADRKGLCDSLRETNDELRRIIDEMKDTERLADENAKLRGLRELICNLEAENAKLRLLLEGLAHCHKDNPHETCPLYRDTDDHSRFENWCRRNELAREFGVDAFDE